MMRHAYQHWRLKTLSGSDVLLLFLSRCSSIPTMLYQYDILLIVVVGVAFNSSSIASIFKALESVLAFLGVEYCKVVVVFEVLGVYFVTKSFGLFIGLFLSVFFDFVLLSATFYPLI